jgi:putative ABC transport system substrate-binding protein
VDRRFFLRTSLAGVVIAPLGAAAQQAGKVYRIGVLSLWPPSTFTGLMQAFREGMKELGYVEGRDYVLDIQHAGGKPDELPRVARMLLTSRVDVLLIGSGLVLRAVTAATQTTPIVVAGPDPVGAGVATSLARPGGNVTGLTNVAALTGTQVEGISGKWLELLRQIVPTLSRILLVMNPVAQSTQTQDIEAAAKGVGLAFLAIPVEKAEEIEIVLSNLPIRAGDGLIVLSESPLWVRRARIAELLARKKLPAIYSLKEYVEAGGLMSYAADYEYLFRRSATYVDKILRGTKPGELPIERPSKFELVINLKTANALGLAIPPSLLLRADRVIE